MVTAMAESGKVDFGRTIDGELCFEQPQAGDVDEATILAEKLATLKKAQTRQLIPKLDLPQGKAADLEKRNYIWSQISEASQDLDPLAELQTTLEQTQALERRLRRLEAFDFYCPVRDDGLEMTPQGLSTLLRQKLM